MFYIFVIIYILRQSVSYRPTRQNDGIIKWRASALVLDIKMTSICKHARYFVFICSFGVFNGNYAWPQIKHSFISFAGEPLWAFSMYIL